jgi:hypothetical protein
MGIADSSTLASACHDKIERAIVSPRQAPCERLLLLNTVIFESPRLPVISRFINATTETAGVERAVPNRTRRVQKNVGYGSVWHS